MSTVIGHDALLGLANLFWLDHGLDDQGRAILRKRRATGSILYVVGNAPLTALLQTRISNRRQGRVLSLFTTDEAMAAPIGLALIVPLGEAIGISWLFVLMGILGMLVALSGLLSPAVRQIGRADIGR